MWIAVEGVIGCGKSTTAKILAERDGATPLLEHAEDHPLLPSFYANRKRYALAIELAFILHHIDRVDGAAGDRWIGDFSPTKDLVFGSVGLDHRDFATLQAIFDSAWRVRPEPDQTVFLDVPTSLCLERVQMRGRSYEQRLSEDDLESLREAYINHLDRLGAAVSLLELTGRESREEVASLVNAEIDP